MAVSIFLCNFAPESKKKCKKNNKIIIKV